MHQSVKLIIKLDCILRGNYGMSHILKQRNNLPAFPAPLFFPYGTQHNYSTHVTFLGYSSLLYILGKKKKNIASINFNKNYNQLS